MHPCGLVLSRQPLHELTPTFIANKGYATTDFDMDSVEPIGLVKMDILAQGGLAVMRDVKARLDARGIEVDLERCVARQKADGELLLGNPHAAEPWCDPEVWKMIAGGNARAVHHIESPAMTSLCRMCNVNEIDGLVAIVSVIRPGAANEGKKGGSRGAIKAWNRLPTRTPRWKHACAAPTALWFTRSTSCKSVKPLPACLQVAPMCCAAH
jgi:DNA polymerase III alpha subunit